MFGLATKNQKFAIRSIWEKTGYLIMTRKMPSALCLIIRVAWMDSWHQFSSWVRLSPKAKQPAILSLELFLGQQTLYLLKENQPQANQQFNNKFRTEWVLQQSNLAYMIPLLSFLRDVQLIQHHLFNSRKVLSHLYLILSLKYSNIIHVFSRHLRESLTQLST